MIVAGILIVVAIGVALGVLIGGILLSVVAYYMRRSVQSASISARNIAPDCKRTAVVAREIISFLGWLVVCWCGAFTCVGWQVTLCDPIRQVTPRRPR